MLHRPLEGAPLGCPNALCIGRCLLPDGERNVGIVAC